MPNVRSRSSLLALGLLTLSVATARATDVYYHDKEATSESGRYLLQAKSPHNAAGKWTRPFARNFTYTLTDLNSLDVIWTRKQGKDEGSCVSLFLANDGWAVIRTGADKLICVDPAGKDTGIVDILDDAFSKEDRANYVQWTTAGNRWSSLSRWYFARQGRRRLFVVRPWWDNRARTIGAIH